MYINLFCNKLYQPSICKRGYLADTITDVIEANFHRFNWTRKVLLNLTNYRLDSNVLENIAKVYAVAILKRVTAFLSKNNYDSILQGEEVVNILKKLDF